MEMKITNFPFSFEYGNQHITINQLENDKLKIEIHPVNNPEELKTVFLDKFGNPELQE